MPQIVSDLVHLECWPDYQAKLLTQLIHRYSHQNEYAVFDMDNTSYLYDVTEALLAFLEWKGVLTRNNMNLALEVVPFCDDVNHRESLYSYYQRLCRMGDLLSYPWIAQVFSGLSLKTVKLYLDEMMSAQQAIPVCCCKGEGVWSDEWVYPPRLLPAMQELYRVLQQNGIEVYVVTAANEEVARMLIADEHYGYGVKPENVIGVRVWLRDTATNQLVNTHEQIQSGLYYCGVNDDKLMTHYLATMTWHEGKLAAITGSINEWKKPILVAGDTPLSDGYMLLYGVDAARGGMRLWVSHGEEKDQKIRDWYQQAAQQEYNLGQPMLADKNWLTVSIRELLP